MSHYPYESLDRNRQDIRLLRIDVGSRPRYTLVPVVPLNIAKFVAISYPWGDHQENTTLTVDGHKCIISNNLAYALRDVILFWTKTYPARRDLFLWTDQICINQKDDHEKNYQVGMMADIFAAASQVVVWLPTQLGIVDGFEGWSAWRDWHRGQILDSNRHNLPQPSEQPKYCGSIEMVFPCVSELDRQNRDLLLAWSHIHGIVTSAWWGRGWVYQEFMGSSKATLIFGGFSTTWEKLNELLSLYYSQRDAHVKFCTDELNLLKGKTSAGTDLVSGWFKMSKPTQAKEPAIAQQQRAFLRYHGQQIIQTAPHWQRAMFIMNNKVEWTKRRQNNPTTYTELSTLLKHSRNCLLSDPKDRVYAFLALASPAYNIEINYSDAYSVNSVLTDAACAIIIQEQRLDILAIARENTNPHNTINDHLPSWVPDWSTPDNPNSIYRQFLREIRLPLPGFSYGGNSAVRASLDLAPTVTFLPDIHGHKNRLLHVHGVQVDELDRLVVDLDYKPFRTFRARSGREVDTVKQAAVGDVAWMLFGADEVYTLRKTGMHQQTELDIYVILGHAFVREMNGVTSDIMHGRVVRDLQRGIVRPSTILIS